MKRTILAAALLAVTGYAVPAVAADHAPMPPKQKWSFAGPFGHFDRGQLQRGFRVYRDVCSVCHGLNLLSFRNLSGLGYSEAQIQQIASEYKVQDGPNDQGEMFERPGRPADRFPPPFPNDNTARARYGAVPPDMSVIAKARTYDRGDAPWFLLDIVTQYQEQGADYMVALLTGYENPPQGFNLTGTLQYNKYFPGHAIAMPPPLSDKRVDYTDGTEQTTLQYAKDVTAFLVWAAEPHMEARKRIGMQVMVFLIIFAGLMFYTKKKVWSAAH